MGHPPLNHDFLWVAHVLFCGHPGLFYIENVAKAPGLKLDIHATGRRLHAYVLMGNHVHLLATPPEAGALGRMVHKVGRQYMGQFNALHGRTGTLWEGR